MRGHVTFPIANEKKRAQDKKETSFSRFKIPNTALKPPLHAHRQQLQNPTPPLAANSPNSNPIPSRPAAAAAMVRCSNGLLGLLNACVLVLAAVTLGGGVWLSHRASTTDCERFLERPIIVLGVLLLVLSLAGLAGSLCRASCLLWLYLLALFLLIVLLFAFTVFAFVVTNRGAGWVVSGRGYKEYRLGGYSTWLQRRVENEENWAKIRSCLQDSKVCEKLGARKEPLSQFVNTSLSPIQVLWILNSPTTNLPLPSPLLCSLSATEKKVLSYEGLLTEVC
jgi:hypothetical protein